MTVAATDVSFDMMHSDDLTLSRHEQYVDVFEAHLLVRLRVSCFSSNKTQLSKRSGGEFCVLFADNTVQGGFTNKRSYGSTRVRESPIWRDRII